MMPIIPKTVRLLLLAVVAVACISTNTYSQTAAEDSSRIETQGIGPNLVTTADGTGVLSYVATTGSENALVYRVIRDGKWSAPHSVASGKNWFVNWADFPSVVPITRNLWAAHWLVRREAGGYAYDAHAAVSEDAGESWSEPFLLHNDGTDTEHGFVTLFPAGKGIGAIWLDGRNMSVEAATTHEHASIDGMTLRAGYFDAGGVVKGEQVIDELTCDCCQTDVGITNEGPVALYRNRSEDEIRDIYISRFVDGSWQEGYPVHDDGWKIAGCPVNGPVVSANGATVVVTWFTAADDRPLVKSAWSLDAGRTFSPPIVVADQGVVGYVGSALNADDSIVASWLCSGKPEGNSICYRAVHQNGELGSPQKLQTIGTVARISVPQLAIIDDHLLLVWTNKIEDQFRISSQKVPL